MIWQHGPGTVRQIWEKLSPARQTGYTTVLKLLQIMTEKGLVNRDERQRTHIYHSRLTQDQTQRQLVNDLLDRAFGGSAHKLVMHALAAKKASKSEMAQIQQLLEKIEGGER